MFCLIQPIFGIKYRRISMALLMRIVRKEMFAELRKGSTSEKRFLNEQLFEGNFEQNWFLEWRMAPSSIKKNVQGNFDIYVVTADNIQCFQNWFGCDGDLRNGSLTKNCLKYLRCQSSGWGRVRTSQNRVTSHEFPVETFNIEKNRNNFWDKEWLKDSRNMVG